MGFFDVDYDKMVWQNLPVRLRQSVQYAWLKCLAAPAKYVYNLFKNYSASILYLLAHNGQVCYMEAALNDTFDNISRGIYISDAPAIDPDWWALDAEVAPSWWALDSESAPDWWPLDIEISASGIGFIVNVPVAVVFDVARMKALINKYKLPCTFYSIVTF